METQPTHTSHLLFKQQLDDIFVLDPLMTLCELERYPAAKQKSRFKSIKMLKGVVEVALNPHCQILNHQFDLLFDTQLAVKLVSDKPIQFNKAVLCKQYAESGLSLYLIRQALDQNLEIVNLLTGSVLKVSSDGALFNRLMKIIFPLWKEIFAFDYGNSVRRVNERVKIALIFDQFDALMKYARSRSHNKELCWFE